MIDYEVLDHHLNGYHENVITIHIKEGPYKGVCFQYDKIVIGEEIEDGIQVDYNLIIVDNSGQNDIQDSQEFSETTNQILQDIFEKAIENAIKEEEKNENGTTDSSKSNT